MISALQDAAAIRARAVPQPARQAGLEGPPKTQIRTSTADAGSASPNADVLSDLTALIERVLAQQVRNGQTRQVSSGEPDTPDDADGDGSEDAGTRDKAGDVASGGYTNPTDASGRSGVIAASLDQMRSFAERFRDQQPLPGIATASVIDAFMTAREKAATAERAAAERTSAEKPDEASVIEDFIKFAESYAERFRPTANQPAQVTAPVVQEYLQKLRDYHERFKQDGPTEAVVTGPVVEQFIAAQQTWAERFAQEKPIAAQVTAPVVEMFLQNQKSYAERFSQEKPIAAQVTAPIVQQFLEAQQGYAERFKPEKAIPVQATGPVVRQFLDAQASYAATFRSTEPVSTYANGPMIESFLDSWQKYHETFAQDPAPIIDDPANAGAGTGFQANASAS